MSGSDNSFDTEGRTGRGGIPAKADFSYEGLIDQAAIEHIVDAASIVAALLGWDDRTVSRVRTVTVELCQNIAEHAVYPGVDNPPPYARPGKVIIGRDDEGVFVETQCTVAVGVAASLRRDYDHLRKISAEQLEAEYRQVLTVRRTVSGERSAGLYSVARNATVGPDGLRRIDVHTNGSVVDSKVYVN